VPRCRGTLQKNFDWAPNGRRTGSDGKSVAKSSRFI
jgi:hypothetical protein